MGGGRELKKRKQKLQNEPHFRLRNYKDEACPSLHLKEIGRKLSHFVVVFFAHFLRCIFNFIFLQKGSAKFHGSVYSVSIITPRCGVFPSSMPPKGSFVVLTITC